MENVYSGSFRESLSIEHDQKLALHFEERAAGSLMLFIHENVQLLDLTIAAGKYSDVKLFIQNLSGHSLAFGLDAYIEKDAKCSAGFLDLEEGVVSCREKIWLKEEGAAFEIFTGQLAPAGSTKKTDMEIIHEAPHTYGNMHNFSVQFADSYYEMVANGNIHDKCPGSQSHQETRVLTLGQSARNKVIPLLLIDENDVKASHALSIGQPDAQQMYYLCSRGLSRAQAMGLLSIGYFMPVIDLIDDEEKRKEVREEMERKVGLNGDR